MCVSVSVSVSVLPYPTLPYPTLPYLQGVSLPKARLMKVLCIMFIYLNHTLPYPNLPYLQGVSLPKARLMKVLFPAPLAPKTAV